MNNFNEWCDPNCNCKMCQHFDAKNAAIEYEINNLNYTKTDWNDTYNYIEQITAKKP